MKNTIKNVVNKFLFESDIYSFNEIYIYVSQEDYDNAMYLREKYKFRTLGVATFTSDPTILWRVIDQNEYDYIKKSGLITGGNYAVPVERLYGASFSGSRADVIEFGLKHKEKTNRLKGQLYVIGINAYDKTFLNLTLAERLEALGHNYEPETDISVTSEIGNIGLGFSVKNVSKNDIRFFYKLSDNGELTDIYHDSDWVDT
jgi:hypothetical protein